MTGPVCWATTVYYKGNEVHIVPTPELQPWVEYEPMENAEWYDGEAVEHEEAELDYDGDY